MYMRLEKESELEKYINLQVICMEVENKVLDVDEIT